MSLHGGRFENYLYRETVTHIVCSNLPDTKVKQLAHERCVTSSGARTWGWGVGGVGLGLPPRGGGIAYVAGGAEGGGWVGGGTTSASLPGGAHVGGPVAGLFPQAIRALDCT